MTKKTSSSTAATWARFRFSVIGSLLSAPPARGQLQGALKALADKTWTHPVSGETVQFAAATIERWYYKARREPHDPVGSLQRLVRKDAGKVSLAPALAEQLRKQHDKYPHWSYQLHYDNLKAWRKAQRPEGARKPSPPNGRPTMASYSTVRRYMHSVGMTRQPRPRQAKGRPGAARAQQRRETREIRSYEAEHVGALWHLDFHHGSHKVLTENGQWERPIALGILDDHSRLCCHLQWYLSETAEDLAHGLSQAIQKRGLPRALMTDNGAAMVAEEFQEGLLRLGIVHEKTLPYSPYQNGKQEAFWGVLEGRLMRMLENCGTLSLDFLNQATQAWSEIEYNRSEHREIGTSPLKRFLRSAGAEHGCWSVLRESPSSEALREAFRLQTTRMQRVSDGTISVDGVRFELPSRFRHFRQVTVRYARWDLRRVDLVDARSGTILSPIYPLDRSANSDARRPFVESVPSASSKDAARDETTADREQDGDELPPLLKSILEEYSATGLPPAYLPKKPSQSPNDSQSDDDSHSDDSNNAKSNDPPSSNDSDHPSQEGEAS